ncbi:amino acid deaminase [Subtercola sp. YIM 133946]|uniref:amino acid deaminase n=1 Tax=Subtercola sp. YIM 133946 TaxID=3118909 RepID=UPI002F941629
MAENGDFIERVMRASVAAAGVEAAAAEGAGGVDAEVSAKSRAEVGRMLAQNLPELMTSLGRDRAAGAFARWGLSTVVDENLQQPVIGRALFESLHDAAGIEARWPLGNAGLLHVYGYLLSTVSTPYGLKRERWIGTDLSHALGLPDGAFVTALASPDGEVGLLQFVTAALTGSRAAADTRVVVDEFAGEEREEIARATFVGPRDAVVGAVVYEIVLAETAHLITAFPVGVSSERWLEGFTAAPPRLRYNAAAHELPPRSPLASRRVRLLD